MKRLSYEYVWSYFNDRHYKLVSTTYNNSQEKLDTICPAGHPYPVSFNNFKDHKNGESGTRCGECSKQPHKRYKIEFVTDYLAKYGFVLSPASTYIGVKNPITIICERGHKHPTTFDLVKNGKTKNICPTCYPRQNKKFTEDEIRLFVESEGYLLKFYDFVDNEHKLLLECPRGHDYPVTFDKFKNEKNRCRTCWKQGLPRGENHPAWKGGISDLAGYLRNYISPWKRESLLCYQKRCVITGETENLVIHHMYSFNNIVKEALNQLQFPIYEKESEYTMEQLEQIITKTLEIHYRYGLGIPITQEVHQRFHNRYGHRDNTPEQFYEFAEHYYQVDWESIQQKRNKGLDAKEML